MNGVATGTLRPNAGGEQPRITGGNDLRLDGLAAGVTDAILACAGTTKFYVQGSIGGVERDADGQPKRRAMADRASEFRGAGLIDIARAYLVRIGVTGASQMTRPQIAQAIVNPGKMAALMATAGLAHTTSDFSAILEDSVGTRLRTAYLESGRTWTLWASERTAPDFEDIKTVQVGSVPTPPVVREGAEYQYATIGESAEVYRLVKHGSILNLSWESVLADRLGAFMQTVDGMATACRRIEDDVVYAELTGGRVMADGHQLFSDEHRNRPAGAELSVESLGAARAAMRQQTGLGGERLALAPRSLIVPAAVETIADQLVNSIVDPAKANDAANPFSGRLSVVPEPRLDEASATAWYLAAAPEAGASVEVAFLEGMREPQIQEGAGFSSDCRQFKVKHSVAARAVDWRGLIMNPGV